MNEKKAKSIRSIILIALISIWILFTVSLTIWWYIYSQRQIDRLAASELADAVEILKDQQMLFWEGGALILSLFLGGGALLYLVAKDRRQTEQLREFFLAFTHELKTPLSNVRLYAETLADRLSSDPKGKEKSQHLMAEVDRLTMQLDNAMELARVKDPHLFVEKINFLETLRSIIHEFPDLNINLTSENNKEVDLNVHADSEALKMILRNIFRNSLTHGKASKVEVTYSNDNQHTNFIFTDNGIGITGDNKLLATRFGRLYSGSGSGVGLYLCKKLLKKMRGKMYFPSSSNTGFNVAISLKAA
jgi:signal transduction histidine kinase